MNFIPSPATDELGIENLLGRAKIGARVPILDGFGLFILALVYFPIEISNGWIIFECPLWKGTVRNL